MATILLSDSLSELAVSAIESNSENKLFTEFEVEMLQLAVDTKVITTKGLKLLSLFLKKEGKERRLQDFMSGSKKTLHFPDFVVEPKQVTEEQEKRKEYLQRKQQAREYNMMMYGKEKLATEDESVSATLKSAKYQIAVSSNMLVTIVAIFGIGYYGATKLGYKSSVAMVIGLIASIVMLAVEMVLYIIRTIKMEEYAARSLKNPKTALKINEK